MAQLPAGFVPDPQPTPQGPQMPAGFVPDATPTQGAPTPPAGSSAQGGPSPSRLQQMWNNLSTSDEWQNLVGAAKGVGDTANTVVRIGTLGKYGLSDVSRAVTGHDVDLTAENDAQSQGKVLETVAELVTGDELLKAVGFVPKIGTVAAEGLKAASASGRLARIAPVVRMMEKYPGMTRVLATGLDTMARQGILGTAQGTLKGGETPGQAVMSGLKTGLTTGLTGGLADIGLGSAGLGIEKLRPATAAIGGETAPVLSEAGAKVGKPTAKMTADQQAAAQRIMRSTAQRSTAAALDGVNQSRYAVESVTPAERMLPAPEGEPRPFQFTVETDVPRPKGAPLQPGAEGPPVPERFERTRGQMQVEARKKQIGTGVEARPEPGSVEPTPEQAAHTAAVSRRYVDPNAPEPGPRPTGTARETIEPGRAVRKFPLYQYLTSARPGSEAIEAGLTGPGTMTIDTPERAQLTLSRMDELMESRTFAGLSDEEKQAISAQRDSLEHQLNLYHAHQAGLPNFAPVDARAVASGVDNMGEGADQIEAMVKPVYQKLDELSDGRFGTLREQQKRGLKNMYNAASEDAYQEAFASYSKATEGINDIFDQNRVNIRPQEYTSAQQGYAAAQRMRELHEAIEGAFNRSAPSDLAAKIGQPRTINGDKLTDNLNRLIRKGKPEEEATRAQIENTIGKDGLENLYRVGDLLKKPETAAPTENFAREITKYLFRRAVYSTTAHAAGLPWWAAAGAAGTEDATRWVLRKIATTPQAGQMLDYAVRHNVADKIAVPLIAATFGALQENPPQETPPTP